MDFELLRARAKAGCEELVNSELIRIRVSALSDNPVGAAVLEAFQNGLKNNGLAGVAIQTGSFGYYAVEPLVIIEMPGHPTLVYPNVDEALVDQLVQAYLVGGDPCIDMIWYSLGPETIGTLPYASDLPLFQAQQRIALKNCGMIDPERIESCIVDGRGYSGFLRALGAGPEQVIRQVSESGLRGRGGAGYSTAEKWEAVARAESSEKIVVCNAVDADPESRTAQLLLEGDPHRVLEGLLIASYAIGAGSCLICVDQAQTTALGRLERALSQMRDFGLLGENIQGAGFSTDIQVRAVQGGLVAGEETALLRALSGRQAMPYLRGPYPAEKGLGGNPTLVQNIETLADVAAVFQESPRYFASIGTSRGTGTKIVTLTDSGLGPCTMEVPFGTSLRRILASSGTASDNDSMKAVQLGGPLGSYWSGDALDTPLDFDTVTEAGGIMGSGVIDMVASTACMVRETARTMADTHGESCGKCVFCREGTLQMADILKSIQDGQGNSRDLSLLKELGEQMRAGCICGLGRNAPNPVLSALALFQSEFDSHIQGHPCPACSESGAGKE